MKKIYKKGDIVFVKYPFTNLTEFKIRPALVLRDQDGEDVILLPISTAINLRRQDIIIGQGNFNGKPLPVKSAIRIGKIATIQANLIVKKVSGLKKAFFENVRRKFMNYILA